VAGRPALPASCAAGTLEAGAAEARRLLLRELTG
jgi:hypothetical protein